VGVVTLTAAKRNNDAVDYKLKALEEERSRLTGTAAAPLAAFQLASF
jgi:hypothetical protein